jgi:hypothetical protein
MKFHLALRDSTWLGDGAQSTDRHTLSYDVTGMPPSEAAIIRQDPTTRRWCLHRKGKDSREAFDSATAALAALQRDIDDTHLSR